MLGGMKVKTFDCLTEALRRHFLNSDLNRRKVITEQWLGLGTEADYRPAIQEGYMTWISGQPAPRIMGWLKVTEKGAAVLEKMKSLGVTEKDFWGYNFTGLEKIGNIRKL